MILEGINDIAIGGASPPSAESLIAGYRQMIDRAHAHGAKVIMATLTPAQGGARTFYPAAEEVRRKVNAWAAWDNPPTGPGATAQAEDEALFAAIAERLRRGPEGRKPPSRQRRVSGAGSPFR